MQDAHKARHFYRDVSDSASHVPHGAAWVRDAYVSVQLRMRVCRGAVLALLLLADESRAIVIAITRTKLSKSLRTGSPPAEETARRF